MRRNLIRGVVLLAVAAVLIAEVSLVWSQTPAAAPAQGRGQGKAAAAPAAKPTADVRFGRWKIDQDAPPPQSNIMTYSAWGEGGMKVRVDTVNAQGATGGFGYNTLFDGVFRPVDGQEGSETAVEFINERSTRIQNKRNGVVNQVVINTLSEDGKVINNEYVRMDANGKITAVTHAVYRKIQ